MESRHRTVEYRTLPRDVPGIAIDPLAVKVERLERQMADLERQLVEFLEVYRRAMLAPVRWIEKQENDEKADITE